jgi:hypothetical protein
MEQSVDYTLTFTGRADSGLMAGSYEIEKDGRSATRECYFSPGTKEQAQYLTLITGLSALLVTIEKNRANAFDFTIEVRGELPRPDDPKTEKLRERALGLLRRFGWYEIVEVDETAVMV